MGDVTINEVLAVGCTPTRRTDLHAGPVTYLRLRGATSKGTVEVWSAWPPLEQPTTAHAEAWRSSVEPTLQRLYLLRLPVNVADAMHAIDKVLRELPGTAQHHGRLPENAVEPSPVPIEAAVGDALVRLLAKARGETLPQLLSIDALRAFSARPATSDAAEQVLSAHATGAPRVEHFHLGEDPEGALESLIERGGAEFASPWLLTTDEAVSGAKVRLLTRRLTKLKLQGHLATPVLLKVSAVSSDIRQLEKLQRRVDGKLSRHVGADLRLVATARAGDLTHLARLVESGSCRAVEVDPPALGGWPRTYDMLRLLARYGNDLMVILKPSDEGRRREPPAVTLAELIPRARWYSRMPVTEGPVLHGRRANIYPDERHARFLGKNALRSNMVEREALAHGLTVTRYSPTVFRAVDEHGRSMTFGNSARSDASGACSFIIADQHKGAAQALLSHAGVPLPEGRVFPISGVADAADFAKSIGYPVVAKPVSGTGGTGVTTNIQDEGELAAAFEAIRERPRHAREDVLVQRHLPGQVYRIVVAGDRVIAAAMREPASVIGDGNRSVAELILEKNYYRYDNPRLRKCVIDKDAAADHLAALGLSFDHIPPPGARIYLSDKPYLRNGGDWIEVLEELHPTIAEAAVAAVAAVPELTFCGVDMLLEDHRRPISQQDAGVCELNSCPELVSPQFPLFGTPRPVARWLFEIAAAKGAVQLHERQTRISVNVVVTGRSLGSTYRKWFVRRAMELGVDATITRATTYELCADVSGDVVPVATLSSTAISGPSPREALPTRVTTRRASPAASSAGRH